MLKIFIVALISVKFGEMSNLEDELVDELRALVNGTDDQLRELIGKYAKNETVTSSEADRVRRTLIEPLRNVKVAFIVVDFQNDFVSGTLSVKKGDAGEDPVDALPTLNSLVDEPFDVFVYTLDWHPFNHISFLEHARNSDRKLSPNDKCRKLRYFDVVRFEEPDVLQELYPAHCIQDTWGSQLHSQLRVVPGARFIRKGTEVMIDAYSAFADNKGIRKSELEGLLRSEGITAVVACGLAYDICVKYTLRDAANLGFLAAIATECSKGLSVEKMREADEMFQKKNIALLSTDDVRKIAHREQLPLEWAVALAKNATTGI